MKIDVYAEDLGWLFEDLKRHFAALTIDGIEITSGTEPAPDADAWVALRTCEAGRSPDRLRTAVCIHDFDDVRLYRKGEARQDVHGAGGYILCHPGQRAYLASCGVEIGGVPILDRPIGALSSFRPGEKLPESFRIGWVGRNHHRKRVEWLPETLARLRLPPESFSVLLIGSDLGRLAGHVRSAGVRCDHLEKDEVGFDAYPGLYASMGCLLITSRTEAGPLTLFEALASGTPVVSTPVGWGPLLARGGTPYLTIADDPAGLAAGIEAAYGRRRELFESRDAIAALVAEWRLEGWIEEVVRFAAAVGAGAAKRSYAGAAGPADLSLTV